MKAKQGEEREQPTIPRVMDDDGRGERKEPEEDQRPRVVDKRRFLHLLEEEVSDVEPVEEISRYPSFVEELQRKLKTSEERLLDYAEKVRQARQGMQSEVDAIRQRLRDTMETQLRQSKAQFISSLLDVLDNLNRAVQSAESTQNFEGLLGGIKATTALFERCLQQQGVSVIDPNGEPFDPRFHEAVETVPVEPERRDLVIDVLQVGYRLGEDTLIRPARVSVGQAPEAASDLDGEDQGSAQSPPDS